MNKIRPYLVVSETIKEGKSYIDRMGADFDKKTVNYYTYGGIEFRFVTIEQLRNGSLKGSRKKFSYPLIQKSISVGDYHSLIRPLVVKDKFTVF